MHDFRLPGLVTLGVVVLLFIMAWNVGKARSKYGIAAPATTGNADFERIFRVQMNTIENALMFLPALWVCAAFYNEVRASEVGVVWLVARFWYSFSYAKAASRRGPAFGLSMLAITVLTLGGTWGILKSIA